MSRCLNSKCKTRSLWTRSCVGKSKTRIYFRKFIQLDGAMLVYILRNTGKPNLDLIRSWDVVWISEYSGWRVCVCDV